MQKNNEMKFDKNEFVLGVLKNARTTFYAREFEKMFSTKNLGYREYEGFKSFEEIDAMPKMNEFEKNIAKYLLECHNNPNSEFADETRKIWDFIKPLTYEREYFERDFEPARFMLILNKIGIFNEDTQLTILNKMRPLILSTGKYPEIHTLIATKLLQNSKATNKDKYFAVKEAAAINHDVVRDFVEDSKQDLTTKLDENVDVPDYDQIKDITSNVRSVMSAAKNSLDYGSTYKIPIKNPINKEYIKIVLDEFDLNKILSEGAEYIAKYKSTLEERVKKAESRADEAEKAEHSAQQDKDLAEKELTKERENVEKLKKKNSELTGEMNKLEKANTEMNGKLKKLRIILGKMKVGGLFNKNTDEIKQMQDIIDTYTL